MGPGVGKEKRLEIGASKEPRPRMIIFLFPPPQVRLVPKVNFIGPKAILPSNASLTSKTDPRPVFQPD